MTSADQILMVLYRQENSEGISWAKTGKRFEEFVKDFCTRNFIKYPQVIDMVLHCPHCGHQHIDAVNTASGWMNPPHRSHLCHCCAHIWRPADVYTNGVAAVQTVGKNDSNRDLQPAEIHIAIDVPPGKTIAEFLHDGNCVFRVIPRNSMTSDRLWIGAYSSPFYAQHINKFEGDGRDAVRLSNKSAEGKIRNMLIDAGFDINDVLAKSSGDLVGLANLIRSK